MARPAGEAPEIVCLVGLRGTGKSSLGPLLAGHLAAPFLDLDQELARRHGQPAEPAGTLLERLGLPRFRELESATLASCLAGGGPLVLATGGGVVESPANRDLLCAASRCIWLRASPTELARRVALDDSPRPALTELEPLREFELLEERRSALYASVSELTCETQARALESIADEIFRHLSQ